MTEIRSDSETIAFYQTAPHRCNYLPGNQAVTLFADPAIRKDPNLQKLLSEHGFRRSGELLYRPHCPSCQACVPVRLPVARFSPNRIQRRTWAANQDLSVRRTAPCADAEYLDLYASYLRERHRSADEPAEDVQAASFLDFLTSPWSATSFYEFRCDQRLLAVAVVDRWADAFSAVYTFFDPGEQQRSLGRYAVLYQIEAARQAGLSWVYLGYWIADCRKMRYKTEYQPLEYFRNGSWQATPE